MLRYAIQIAKNCCTSAKTIEECCVSHIKNMVGASVIICAAAPNTAPPLNQAHR
jgi:hypothetical protein